MNKVTDFVTSSFEFDIAFLKFYLFHVTLVSNQ